MTILGRVAAELWATTEAPATDFTAKLIDVYPPSADYPTGFALNPTDGIFPLPLPAFLRRGRTRRTGRNHAASYRAVCNREPTRMEITPG
jgi:predicted acyl esterase